MKKFLWCILGLAAFSMDSTALAQSGLSRVVMSLNTNRDSTLSLSEIKQAPVALATLDLNKNGRIDSNELGNRSANFRRRVNSGEIVDLVLAAIDLDSNNIISATEITDSAWRLIALDADNSGSLSNYELNSNSANIRRAGGFTNSGNVRQGPSLSPEQIPFEDGAAKLSNREAFERLSYQGQEVLIDTELAGLEYVKFTIIGADTQEPQIYFMNTETYRAHMIFSQAFITGGGTRNNGQEMRGILVYRPFLNTPSGESGLYTYEFEPFDIFDYALLQKVYDQLVQNAPVLKGKLAYHPMPAALDRYKEQQEQFESAQLAVFLDEDEYSDIAYLPLNEAEGFGILRLMKLDERPGIRDVVLYESLPNEMPHVAGIITGFRQTPLSHVNLRAVQDEVPNAYIKGATENELISSLIDHYVYYKVAANGFQIREASLSEVDAHFADLRPIEAQVPERNLNDTEIRPLGEVTFSNSNSVGVKAANVATLRTLGLPEEAVPDGFAIPFYFYDEFMKYNGFYEAVSQMMARPDFARDTDERDRVLNRLRDSIKEGDMPDWMMDALTALQAEFPAKSAIRLRSSTNNEDLSSFSGAGLYDSYTHNPDEGHIAKSVKQVFASLWNFRAYEERNFYRIDHYSAAMGILVHPNYSDEIANGVAVSDEVVYQLAGDSPGRTYYVNIQLGEDLVTNPNEASIPEELLLNSVLADKDKLIQGSNRTKGELLLSEKYKTDLRAYMNRVHNTFRELYGVTTEEPFAMEIEFKITVDGNLAIKQARPWVY